MSSPWSIDDNVPLLRPLQCLITTVHTIFPHFPPSLFPRHFRPCFSEIHLAGFLKPHTSQEVAAAHDFNPSTLEAEAGGSLSLRPAWSTELVPGQDYAETPSQKPKEEEEEKKTLQTKNMF